MAASGTNLGSNAVGTPSGTSIATASISPTGNRLLLCAVENDRAAGSVGTPTVAGNGLTWVQVATVPGESNVKRLTVFRAMGASPSAGVVTATWGASQDGFSIVVDEIDGVLTTGSDGADAVRQATTAFDDSSVASLAVALAAFANVANGTYGAFRSGVFGAGSAGSGFTKLAGAFHADGNGQLITEYRADNDTGVDASFGGSTPALGIAFELVTVSPSTIASVGREVPRGVHRGVTRGSA